MTDSAIETYLEKEIVNGERTVTYRLLSRRLSIHVNAAKNALSAFYTRRREKNEPIYATFWLSGIPQVRVANDEMEVDEDGARDWLTRKVIIVGEEDLEDAKAMFSRIQAFHVYSLSVSPLKSPSQLCETSTEVRELDKAGGDDLVRAVGKLVSHQVKRGALPKVPGKSAALTTAPVTTPATPAVTASATPSTSKPVPKREATQQKLKPSPSLSSVKGGDSKGMSKLSWAKAKPKIAKEGSSTYDTPVKVEAEESEKEQAVGNKGGEKRGTKRKSDVMSHALKREESVVESKANPRKELASQISPTSVDATSTARLKKGVVLSEDEDDDENEKPSVQTKKPAKFRTKDRDESDTEQSVRAIMDIDDSFVTKASKPVSLASHDDEEEEPPPTDHVDSAMDEDSDDPVPKPKPKPKSRKSKEKKNVPIGRNGLKKKRVVKSTTKLGEKGYMVTMDYSSYESVDEEEEPQEEQKPRTKSKTTTKTKSSSRKKDNTNASDSDAAVGQTEHHASTKVEAKKTVAKKPTVKSAKERQANGNQKSLASFFGGSGVGKGRKHE